MKLISVFFSISCLCGCATNTIYKDVYIPTQCNITKPSKPPLSSFVVENTRNAIIYTKKLECALDFCISGEIKAECVE